jgi:hypothetical protein
MVEGMKVSQTSSFQQEAKPIYNTNNMQKIEKNMLTFQLKDIFIEIF